MQGATYADAGVDIDAGVRAVDMFKGAVSKTHGPRVLAGVGAFGGLFRLGDLGMSDPVLAASTDGVGTKTRVAAAMNRWDTVGIDLVNHCINDILVAGAEPLFFLDYVASSRLDPAQVAAVVSGMAEACRAEGVALLGGETAEMPGVYVEGELDLVGTIIGCVDRSRILDGSRIGEGDAVWALPSSGLHTNGYSLARRVLADLDWHAPSASLDGQSIGDALLMPHRSYLGEVRALRGGGVDIRGLVHVTGGGLIDNPPRVLPEGLAMRFERAAWAFPPIFQLIQQAGGVADAEMVRVFNCGLGLLLVLPEGDDPTRVLDDPGLCRVGTITRRESGDAVVFA